MDRQVCYRFSSVGPVHKHYTYQIQNKRKFWGAASLQGKGRYSGPQLVCQGRQAAYDGVSVDNTEQVLYCSFPSPSLSHTTQVKFYTAPFLLSLSLSHTTQVKFYTAPFLLLLSLTHNTDQVLYCSFPSLSLSHTQHTHTTDQVLYCSFPSPSLSHTQHRSSFILLLSFSLSHTHTHTTLIKF